MGQPVPGNYPQTTAAEVQQAPGLHRRRRETIGLGILFATIYFAQGIGDPDEGLVAQPVTALLKNWGYRTPEITLFAALIALPWSLKPIYGLFTDFVPLAGSRRKSYLILNSLLTVTGLVVVAALPLSPGSYAWLLSWLILSTLGIAFSDVVVDALMVEKGQPRGITGHLQSVQWTAVNVAGLLTGSLGGYLSQNEMQRVGFLLCAAVMLAALILSFFCIREDPIPVPPGSLPAAVRSLWQSARSPTVLGVGIFLFLWNFNPFSSKVLYLHMTNALGFDEQFAGHTTSFLYAGGIVGSFSYAFYCRRFSMTTLVHVSIVLGILSSLVYWTMVDRFSAILVSVAFGLIYDSANLIGLDLAARACPRQIAGTVFALLMAISNFSISLSTWVGGYCYEQGVKWWGAQTSFDVLVGIGAAFTAGCWLLWPILRRNAAVVAAGLPMPNLASEKIVDLPSAKD
jgi:MFS family permease